MFAVGDHTEPGRLLPRHQLANGTILGLTQLRIRNVTRLMVFEHV